MSENNAVRAKVRELLDAFEDIHKYPKPLEDNVDLFMELTQRFDPSIAMTALYFVTAQLRVARSSLELKP